IVLPGHVTRSPENREPDLAARIDARNRAREQRLVIQACKHVGIEPESIESVRVRREPFFPGQPRADARWMLPRNAQGFTWLAGRSRVHVELVLRNPLPGPLALGDGRWLALGLMAPVVDSPPHVHIFSID